MSEPTNRERAEAARKALASVEKYDPFDQDSITDLMTDLLHLAAEEGMDPRQVVAMATIHFNAEKDDTLIGGNHG